jgi:hypothetical protein
MRLNRILIALIFIFGLSLTIVPFASAKSVYSFKTTCKGNPPLAFVGEAGTTWNWTVNGASMNGGFTFCNTSGATGTGSGTVPSNANGITATMNVHRANCLKTVSTSQSFAPGGPVSITLKASCTGFKAGVGSLTIDATFTLKS